MFSNTYRFIRSDTVLVYRIDPRNRVLDPGDIVGTLDWTGDGAGEVEGRGSWSFRPTGSNVATGTYPSIDEFDRAKNL
jgi:hypothetical protein